MPKLKRGNKGNACVRKRRKKTHPSDTTEMPASKRPNLTPCDAAPPSAQPLQHTPLRSGQIAINDQPNFAVNEVTLPSNEPLELTPVEPSQSASNARYLPSHIRGSISQSSPVFDPPSMGKQCAGCALAFLFLQYLLLYAHCLRVC